MVGVLVLLGGGLGAWLLLRDSDRNGAPDPTAAVQLFLQAVYHDKDPARAAALVCSESRDEDALAAKINEIAAYEGTQVDPTFQWTQPRLVEQTDELAVVSVTITMITGDERVAEQALRVSVLDKQANGWWVCNLETVTITDEAASPGEEQDSEGAKGGESGTEGSEQGESGEGDGG